MEKLPKTFFYEKHIYSNKDTYKLILDACEEMSDCPYCGSPNGYIDRYWGSYAARCYDCKLTAPSSSFISKTDVEKNGNGATGFRGALGCWEELCKYVTRNTNLSE